MVKANEIVVDIGLDIGDIHKVLRLSSLSSVTIF